MMASIAHKITVRWEAAYPALSGLAAAAIGYVYGPHWYEVIHSNNWLIENLFVAIFTLGTVTAGFGLAIYTFLLTTESGFIGRAKRSIYYRHLLTYVLKATLLSAAVALISIPGMVVKEVPAPHSLHAVYLAIWGGVTVWAGAALVRAGHLFSIFAKEHH
ncbi:hypothetical protein ACVWXO_008007 [Bradyrhizobium sp. LM2.7]